MSTTHELKCWIESFQDILEGRKTCEFRKDDRGFRAGDTLILLEWNHREEYYTGNRTTVRVRHITRGFGIPDDHVLMSISAPEPYDLTLMLPTGQLAVLRMPATMSARTFRHMEKALSANLDLLGEAIVGQDQSPPNEQAP